MKIGFLGLLAILFIALKLTGVIAWSWWAVLLPIYGPLLLLVAIPLGVGITAWSCAKILKLLKL